MRRDDATAAVSSLLVVLKSVDIANDSHKEQIGVAVVMIFGFSSLFCILGAY
jgi:hypothetical protein